MNGLVLAGGRGRRMGGADKGLLLWHGEPLALRVLRRLQPQVGPLMISANRNADRYRGWAPVVGDADGEAYLGPLAGIAAALAAMSTDWLAVAPCDLPALPIDVVERLARGRGSALAAFAAPAGQSHALVCLLHASLATRLANDLAAGERRVGAWFGAIGAQPVAFDDGSAFANLNTAEDLSAGNLA